MNKKLLALLLAILMVAVSACAMADGTTQSQITEKTSIPVYKTYTGNGKPAETFTFKTQAIGNAPAIGNITIGFTSDASEGNTLTGSITLPDVGTDGGFTAAPGVYKYVITEVVPNTKTAGMTYDEENSYLLTVTVYNADTNSGSPKYKTTATIYAATVAKDDAGNVTSATESGSKLTEATFTNTYAGTNLIVEKKLAGTGANSSDKFNMQVVFSADSGERLTSDITCVKSADTITVTESSDGYTFTIEGIGNNETVTFSNIPVGAKYTVTETNKTGSVSNTVYTATGEVTAATKIAAETENSKNKVTITNTYDATIDTGVNTDNTPYILLMALVAIMALAFVAKKRSVRE